MKRIVIVMLAGLVALGSIILPSSGAAAGVNDFSFSRFEADYYLSKDSEGRSSLKVVERLTAEFPNFNQNKGIERAIPGSYDGHSVSFKLESLLRNGQPEPIYSQSIEGGNIVVATGDDSYVQGRQTYQLTYILHDVTKFFADTASDEFYWDTNGTQWQQRFDSLIVRVHMADQLVQSLNGKMSCYVGLSGATDPCQINKLDNVYTVSYSTLGPGENVTFAIGFNSGTFSAYRTSLFETARTYLLYVVAAIQLSMWPLVKLFKRTRRARGSVGRGTIIPEYLPPKNESVIVSSLVDKKTKAAMAAEFLSLAVRHNIKIIESNKKQFFGTKKVYTFEVLSLDGLDEDEMKVMEALFVPSLHVGARYEVTRVNYILGQRLQEIVKATSKRIGSNNYFTNELTLQLKLYATVAVVGILSLSLIGFGGTSSELETAQIVLFVGVFLIFFTVNEIATIRPFTDKGIEHYEYLQGLKMYIKLAEADRIRVLQSPEGAEKKSIDTSDGPQLVHLYERMLPYAVLFGEEKQWLKQLGTYYEQQQTQPSWYSGTSGFNGAMFASSVGSFSAYTAASSSSSG